MSRFGGAVEPAKGAGALPLAVAQLNETARLGSFPASGYIKTMSWVAPAYSFTIFHCLFNPSRLRPR